MTPPSLLNGTSSRSAPVTHKMLQDWAGAQIYQEGRQLYERGYVAEVTYEDPFLRGTISRGGRELVLAVRILPDGSAENQCPCRASQDRGIVCAHAVAIGCAAIARMHDPERDRKAAEEARRAQRLSQYREEDFLRRVPAGTPGSRTARLRIELAADWAEALADGTVPLRVEVTTLDGRWAPADAPRDRAYAFPPDDEALLYVLEDIQAGPVPGRLDLGPDDLLNVLDLCVRSGIGIEGDPDPAVVRTEPIPTSLAVRMDMDTGQLRLILQADLPPESLGRAPVYVVGSRSGRAYAGGRFYPLDKVLPGPLQEVYRRPLVIERPRVPAFLRHEMPVLGQLIRLETDLSEDMVDLSPAPARFRLAVRGSPASLSATLFAVYGPDIVLIAGKPDPAGHFALPDPDDLLRFLVRDPAAEKAALHRVSLAGFVGTAGDALDSVVGTREVLNVLGREVPALRREGWQVDLEGRAETHMDSLAFATPVVDIAPSGSNGDFDVEIRFEDLGGATLSPAEIQRAILRGESYLTSGGRTVLIDTGAIESLREAFEDCAAGEGGRPGAFRLNSVHAAYVKSSLDALDGIDVEASPAWLQEAARQHRDPARLASDPLPAPPPGVVLRPYQREGVAWLRSLEQRGFAGILADEMGLGKTLQTLTWLRMPRATETERGKPTLVICPTSLVENWADEAAKFAPDLRVLILSGPDRTKRFGDIPRHDLVVTSYALLRRDADAHVAQDYAAAILDEAQHIKNRSTQNALAAKRLRARSRLVLTGTPLENSVADLWSIMDFLMPGYLGASGRFRERYEQPIAQGGPEAEAAQARLRRKLQPFLLRRLKRDVAKDLPPKLRRVASCTLSPDQAAVYRQLVESSRRRLISMVAAQGFQKSRMEVLKTLLRLRQVCCHLDLLKLPDLQSPRPSAKLELCFELIDEALAGGHRLLVFSQFVSMLHILRRELEARGLRYAYLDGSTQDRLQKVREFNRDRDIPVFLISLKAGGTGLNLTGADMVIHYDPWWNPAVEDQATDRAYRIGQKRQVYSIKLITRGTVEEKVLAMQEKKQAVIDATLAPSGDAVLQSLTWDDVQELLTL